MINDAYKANFNVILRAFANGDVGIMEATEVATGKTVVLLVARQQELVGGDYTMVPLARMFDGNPYEDYAPPEPTEQEAPAPKIILPS